MRPLSCSSNQSNRARGFTLVELMVVLGIILMILGLVAPSMGGILKGKKIEQGISAVTSALETARMEAISQNAYIWVGVINVAPPQSESGQDELWLQNFKVTTPSGNRPPTESSGGTSIPITNLTRVEGINIVSSSKLPKNIADSLPTTGVDLADSVETISPLKWVVGGKKDPTLFTRTILFTPRGEAILDDGSITMPDPSPYLLIGVGQTINGKLPAATKDAAAVLVSGYSGRITTIRP